MRTAPIFRCLHRRVPTGDDIFTANGPGSEMEAMIRGGVKAPLKQRQVQGKL